jgi:putative membrane protein
MGRDKEMDSTTRTLLVALGVLLVVALGLSALMGGVMGPAVPGQWPVGPGMMRGGGWMWGLGMGFGGLVMLTFWGALIVGIVLLVRSIGVGAGAPSHSTPLDTLKRRYAAGEITREQYEQMRKDLEQ